MSRAWKYIALGLIGLELVMAAVLLCTYDFSGDLEEWYFDFGDRLLMIGIFQK
ncbi:MAG: hypothetical protein J6Q96_02865 [Bacteroidales bacterium]|nr:hypothetical protein [Bacteroidales bacterium]